jgi:hypothetical protein
LRQVVLQLRTTVRHRHMTAVGPEATLSDIGRSAARRRLRSLATLVKMREGRNYAKLMVGPSTWVRENDATNNPDGN